MLAGGGKAAQGARLDLPHALAGDAEPSAHLLERVRMSAAQAIADISRRACPKAQIDIVAPDTPNLAWSAVMTADETKLSVGRQ